MATTKAMKPFLLAGYDPKSEVENLAKSILGLSGSRANNLLQNHKIGKVPEYMDEITISPIHKKVLMAIFFQCFYIKLCFISSKYSIAFSVIP